MDKGESLKDTALTLGAYDPDVIVIRHPQIGAPQLVARVTEAHVVNAGDGKHQHPTQALLDLYTLREAFGRLEGLHVAIVGDVLHSRVARSLLQAFALVGIRATLVGPPALLPRELPAETTHGHRGDPRRGRRLRPPDAERADGGRARTSSRASASTRRAGASRPSGCGRGRRSCTPGR